MKDYRRIVITPQRAVSCRFTDTLHAMMIKSYTEAGASIDQVLGQGAAPWTWSANGFTKHGGQMVVSKLIVSCADDALAEIFAKIRPESLRYVSANGDDIDLTDSAIVSLAPFLAPDQDEMRVRFASPFVLTERGTAKNKPFIEDMSSVDLSEAFSIGLSRRMSRPINLDVHVDPLTRAMAKRPNRIVKVRRSGSRDVTFPGFAMPVLIKGKPEDLRDAYGAGLGQKTRYGFGCLVPLS